MIKSQEAEPIGTEGVETSLAECPPGLFWAGDTLGMKSEYGDNSGRIDAFIVESGEFLWGHAPQTTERQRAMRVIPISHDTAIRALATRTPDPKAAGVEREVGHCLMFKASGTSVIGPLATIRVANIIIAALTAFRTANPDLTTDWVKVLGEALLCLETEIERGERDGHEAEELRELLARGHDVVAALRAVDAAPGGGDKLDRDYTKQRIGELIAEGDGNWSPCSGCQESSDGCVSTSDYPYDPVFRCQPGSGCSECGGIGVVWQDRSYYEMFADEAPDASTTAPAPNVQALVEALCRSPAIEDITPSNAEWQRCESVQDTYDLMKRCIRKAAATIQAPAGEGVA